MNGSDLGLPRRMHLSSSPLLHFPDLRLAGEISKFSWWVHLSSEKNGVEMSWIRYLFI